MKLENIKVYLKKFRAQLGFSMVFLALALYASGCIGQEVPPSPKDVAWLTAELRSRGFTVTDAGTVSQVFFSVQGRLVNVDGEAIQVYEYPSPEKATEEANRISPDGSSATYEGGAAMMTWVATPHFYMSGRLIVIYIGDDPEVLSALEGVLGEQFAGGTSNKDTVNDGQMSPTRIINDIDIAILESFPVQVLVRVKGEMRDSCTTIDEVKQEKSGNTFYVTIKTKRPADAICAQVLVPFEESVKLDVYGLKAGVYLVDVHGVRESFELQADNIIK